MSQKKILVPNLPARDFMSQLSAFRGPEVEITVGPEKTSYRVSKELLCQSAPFFDRAFNGNFKEGIDQKMDLGEDEPRAFELIRNNCTHISNTQLADKVDLIGPFDVVVEEMRKVLATGNLLCQATLAMAFQLPVGHAARNLFVSAFVKPYLIYLNSRYPTAVYVNPGVIPKFKYQWAIDDVEGFGTELLGAVGEVLMVRSMAKNGEGTPEEYALDPITKERFPMDPLGW